MTPVIIVGGMTFGWFTPTEAAIAACTWALILGIFLYRSLSLKQFYKVSMDTIETTAGVLLIVAAASLFGWVLTTTRLTEAGAEALLQLTDNKYIILLLINVLLLIVGCFLEPIASISILVPVLMPIILKVGIHPVHFGVVMTLNLMIGLLHPPLGMVLFVLSRIAKLSIERTTMAILPWLIPLMMSLIAITLIPELTLWLPRHDGDAEVDSAGDERVHLRRRRHRRRGAHPLHADRGRGVGVIQRVANGLAAGELRRDRADKAIAGAGGIDGLDRSARNDHRFAINQRQHAALAQRHADDLVPADRQRTRGLDEARVIVGVAKLGLRQQAEFGFIENRGYRRVRAARRRIRSRAPD